MEIFRMIRARRPSLAAAALLVLAAPAAAAPTVDELVDKAIKAMGGKAIDKIESYSASSEMTAPMGTMTTEVYWAKPSHILIKRIVPQMGEMEQGTDGTIGWTKNPMMGGYQLMDDDEIEQIVQQAMHMRVFRLRETLKEDYDAIESAGKIDFEGTPCYELRMKSRQEDATAAIFFAVESGLVRGMRITENTITGPRMSTIKIEDWKPINGVNFFHRVEMTGTEMPGAETGLSVRYTRIEVNNVDPAKLAVPAEVQEAARKRASRPAGAEVRLEDLSPQVQQMVRGMLDGLPWDDAEALRQVRTGLDAQMGRMPGEFKQGMEYVLRKIDERLKELDGAG